MFDKNVTDFEYQIYKAEQQKQIDELERRLTELYNFTYLLADELGYDIQWQPATEAGDRPVKRSKR